MEITVLEEFWWRNGPVGPSLEVDDDDDEIVYNKPLAHRLALCFIQINF
jgi:hypothetical protein